MHSPCMPLATVRTLLAYMDDGEEVDLWDELSNIVATCERGIKTIFIYLEMFPY